ncbi:hypothetical protein [Arundinibacter roseus]|uniref:Uncharacterized protein n=1 Tax=Arundinibacter roseus TaxID=2070510 RepID=A0A4R4K9L3_9BACT|nr:hypothetical protein [Arundinibacter roseus]TDB63312.1 hypothetical protein EZE20_16185 [Arundinibacter roseus]
METFGDKLYRRVIVAKNNLFLQGEIAQLTYQSFHRYVQLINETEETEIEITYPIGYSPDNTPIHTTVNYSKEHLIDRYQFLGLNQLPINGLYQLVTTIEALLGDILRNTLVEFPVKISNKRKLDFELVLEAKSLDEIKTALVNSIINELSYKSPKDFAEEFTKYVGINLLEKPTFHKYIELKATRDIYIHNQGVANEIYLSKADSFARVKSGQYLPVDIQYFLQSYECCLQITEILEDTLNKIWPSLEYNKNKTQNLEVQKSTAIEQAIERVELIENQEEPKLNKKRK